jgi:protein SCO1/2
MTTNNRNGFLKTAFTFLAMFCFLTHSIPGQSETARPNILKNVGLDQNLNAQIDGNLRFTDEHGEEVQLNRYFGDKPIILTLVYYECPMLCTLILNGLIRSIRTLNFNVGEEFEIVTVSIDPDETPDLAKTKKNQYLENYERPGAAEGWHFLTGKQDQISELARTVGFRYVYDEKSGEYAHASGIMILTPEGRVARYYYGVEYSPRDLRLGLVEASNEVIGSPVDQILLFCYHYDPTTGKYSVAIMSFLRLAGIVTVLAIGSFLFIMIRRDRRRVAHT